MIRIREARGPAGNSMTAVSGAQGFRDKAPLSRPGFIRAQVNKGNNSLLIAWAAVGKDPGQSKAGGHALDRFAGQF